MFHEIKKWQIYLWVLWGKQRWGGPILLFKNGVRKHALSCVVEADGAIVALWSCLNYYGFWGRVRSENTTAPDLLKFQRIEIAREG
jgi:hypothetical protein